MLLDVAVNAIPAAILPSFVALFLAVGSSPADPPVVVAQVSPVAVPPLLAALTYHAVRAVTAAERDGPDLPPGDTREGAETATAAGGSGDAGDD